MKGHYWNNGDGMRSKIEEERRDYYPKLIVSEEKSAFENNGKIYWKWVGLFEIAAEIKEG